MKIEHEIERIGKDKRRFVIDIKPRELIAILTIIAGFIIPLLHLH